MPGEVADVLFHMPAAQFEALSAMERVTRLEELHTTIRGSYWRVWAKFGVDLSDDTNLRIERLEWLEYDTYATQLTDELHMAVPEIDLFSHKKTPLGVLEGPPPPSPPPTL
jgi:hypothetical protein